MIITIASHSRSDSADHAVRLLGEIFVDLTTMAESMASSQPSATPTPEPKATRKPWYHPYKLAGFLLENWFLIGIGVVIVLAWRFPGVAKEDGSECLCAGADGSAQSAVLGELMGDIANVDQLWLYCRHLLDHRVDFGECLLDWTDRSLPTRCIDRHST